MLFSQKKLAKLKQTEQGTETDVCGRNAAVLQVCMHDNVKMSKRSVCFDVTLGSSSLSA